MIVAMFSAISLLSTSISTQVDKPNGAAPVNLSNWHITDKSSELDNAHDLEADVKSEGTVTDILGRDGRALFGLSCSAKGFFVTIVWPDFVEGPDTTLVKWKIDDGAVQQTTFVAVTRAAVMMGKPALKWAEALGSAKRLVVRVPDKHGGQDAAFDVEGIERVIATINERGCH